MKRADRPKWLIKAVEKYRAALLKAGFRSPKMALKQYQRLLARQAAGRIIPAELGQLKRLQRARRLWIRTSPDFVASHKREMRAHRKMMAKLKEAENLLKSPETWRGGIPLS